MAKGHIEEFESIDLCIKTLLQTSDFGKFQHELVISEPDRYENVPKEWKDKVAGCEYIVEIYDDWRE